MTRLESELRRLYPLPVDPADDVRALVLSLAGPADWDVLARVWYGVQSDLALPAPGIAVSGTDALQLWFSLAQPMARGEAAGFLARLQARYLADIAPARLHLMPPGPPSPVPALQPASGHWSAFIAADLAPVFVDTPWLDVQPSEEGQADLLARLQSIKPAAFEAAMRRLQPAPGDPGPAPPAPAAADGVDPRQFLQRVLNDETVALALRIEAAKALLR